ncbi:MAG: lasso peptide biosynthesis B2 protein [Chloroflexi bacterium]|nr:lasso peptide biosynthesis B2 protein [Chloroflexota bacterium]
MITRLRHWWFALSLLPFLFSSKHRALLREMRSFCELLPIKLKPSLIDGLRLIDPRRTRSGTKEFNEDVVRNFADLAALLDRRSTLGLCLRRSLTRYYFLRRVHIPVVIRFGAKFLNGKADREITGHAWLTLNDAPYYEEDENWRGFTVMMSYPTKEER